LKNAGKNVLIRIIMIVIKSVRFRSNNIAVEMSNGKVIETSITSYPNLSKGTENQLNNYEIKGDGRWIHWNELDEDRSAEGFLSI
jgi:hypothetical protein